MNRRGQFFLIASLVVIAIIISLAAVNNSVRSPREDVTVYDLSNEVLYEGGEVINQGIINPSSQMIEERLQAILQTLYQSQDTTTEFLVVYGTRSGDSGIPIITATLFYCEPSSITGGPSTVTVCQKKDRPITVNAADIDLNTNTVKIRISPERIFTFNIQPGQTFYFVIQKSSEETTVVTSGTGQPLPIPPSTTVQ